MKTSKKQPKLEARERRDGTGWFVLVTWGDRPSEQVGGFPSQAEAQQWIDRSGPSWVREHRVEDSGLAYDRG
jgi:hypothetical protein